MTITQATTDDDWRLLQEGIHRCAICLSDAALVSELPVDSRPPSPGSAGRLLLISEAPPSFGGFWRLPRPGTSDARDDLRENILTLLQARQLPPVAAHGPEALESFLSAGFFLVQTMKWPLAKTARRRATFNHLAPKTKVRLITHTVEHLRSELILIQPRGILSMGNAALDACRQLDELGRLPTGGVEHVRPCNVNRPEICFQKRNVPVDVTYLAVDENVRKPNRALAIREDFDRFLDRHGWTPSDSWPGIGRGMETA